MAKGRNYKITGALETHPKAIPLKFEIELVWSRAFGPSCSSVLDWIPNHETYSW